MQTREISPRKVDLINIGDELLDGLCDNKHLRWLGEQLARTGLRVRRNIVVRDDDGQLLSEFSRSWQDADVVITTGGMGARFDDFTRETISRFLGRRLIYDKKAEAQLIAHFSKTNRAEVTGADLTQCWLPEGAELLPNIYGTSPGILLRDDGRILLMLPGDAPAMQEIFSAHAVPVLRSLAKCPDGESPFVQVRAFGSTLALTEDRIRAIVNETRIKVISTENDGLIDIRLMPGGSGFCGKGLLEVAKRIREELGEEFICTGTRSLADIVAEQLLAMEKTISIAESCTGGLLSGALTEIPGISKSFIAGAVTYHPDIKEFLGVPSALLQQHGEVSAESAIAMASAAAERFGTDYGISITGYAGPSSETIIMPEEGPTSDSVGTVFIGYSSPHGDWVEHHRFRGDRSAVRRRAVNSALNLLRRKLTKYRMEDLLVGIK